MALFQIAPPSPFEFRNPESWVPWKKRFERFRIATKLEDGEGELQVNTLIYTMGGEAEEILTSFGLSAEELQSYQTVMDKFDSFFVVKRNVIFERAKFNSRKQENGETVDNFITALYSLAEHCQYQVLKDEMIRDRIVVGLVDSNLSLKLQLNATLTLETAITQARQSESIRKQQDVMRNNFQPVKSEVDAIWKKKSRDSGSRRTQSQGKGKPGTHQQNRKKQSSENCPRCGGIAHAKQDCPAKDTFCKHCKKKGHWIKVCRSAPKSVNEVTETQHDFEVAFLGTVETKDSKPWLTDVKIANHTTRFKIDTGADVTVISEDDYSEVAKSSNITLEKSDQVLDGAGGARLEVLGQFRATLVRGDKKSNQKVYVARKLHIALLGRPALEDMEIVRRVESVSADKNKYMQQYPELFTGLGNTQHIYKIELLDGAKPYALSTPRRIALPLMQQVKDELSRMESLGVISPVTEPTEWCSGMVVIPKPGNKVRICVDLTMLNESVRRENHPLPSIEQTLGQLAGAKYFSKLDANSGFYQVPLAKESALLTTFITPYGRYCFNRLPFGISSAPEVFQKQMSQILEGTPGVACQIDDVLVSGRTSEEHDARLKVVLDKIRNAGVTLNGDKCMFRQTCIKFLGFIIDESGVKADPEKIAAITNMKEPTSVAEVRRFLGMVNFLSKFSPSLAEQSKPIRDLLHSDSAWCWDQPQQRAFDAMKKEISSTPTLAHYDSAKKTKVSADASSYGLGAVLLQAKDDKWKPVAYASRALTKTEQRYAQIEKEALATTWACERFSMYITGLRFSIETDHKPLISLLGTKDLDLLPLRIQRFRMRLMRFDYSIGYIPGKNLVLADTLSRAQLSSQPSDTEDELSQETNAYVDSVLQAIPATEGRLEELRSELAQDEVCKQLMEYCQTGWPDRSNLYGALKAYFAVRHDLTVERGLLLRGRRLVIPMSMRLDMMDRLHKGHQGIVKCRQRAKQTVWWPGLSKQLQALVENCTECIKERINPPEPLMPTSLPERPWQRVGSDLFHLNGANYLLVIDYYSRYIEIAKLSMTTSQDIINHMKSMFARHGIPEILMSDNGPQFSAELFQTFAGEFGFKHVTSSPKFPQSNGEAERAVQTVKSLLKKERDPYLALLVYRSTPLQNGFSPSELLMGRRLRTTVPVLPELLNPKIPDLNVLRSKEAQSRSSQKANFDWRHRARDLVQLEPGQTIWAKDIGHATVQEKAETPRSYNIETSSGSYRRNRRDLLPISSPARSTPPACSTPSPAGTPTPAKSPSETTVTVTRAGRKVKPPKRLDW